MPSYNGVYYYMNSIDKVGAVCFWENRWFARYEVVEDSNLPLSIQQDQFPENDFCPFMLYRDEFLAKFNDTAENLMVYTQDENLKNLILSNAPPSAKSNPIILSNGVLLYKWTQKSSITCYEYGIVLLYDKDGKMTGGIRVAGIIWLALIIAIAVIVYTALQVYNNYLTQQYTTTRQHEALEAMRYFNRTTVTDAQGNPLYDVWQFGNGSVYTYDYKTGKFEQQQAGVSGQALLDTIPQGNVATQVGIENILTTVVYAVIVIAIVIGILFAIKALAERRK